jgi:hypothetical protein
MTEEEISRRPILNGRSILTIWLATRLIARNLTDFYLQKPCKLILEKFKKFTNLAEKKLIFDEEDQLFLDKFTQDFKGACVSFNVVRHHSDSRKMWEIFFTELWESRGFVEFEQKYAGRILIPLVMMDDGNMQSIFNKLYFLEELCSFSSELKLSPSETQLISSLYDLSGLTSPEKDKLLRDGKKMADIKHQKDKIAAKLTAAETAIKTYQDICITQKREREKEQDMFERLLDFQHAKNTDLEAQIAELKMNLEAAKQELGKQGVDAIPICHICQEPITASSHAKLLGCCGYPIHTKCFENMCMANPHHRPPCPQCRERREEQYQFTPLTRNHPLLRQPILKEMQHFSTSVCEADFLEGVIGGDKIEPILRKDRTLSIYEQMVRSSALQKKIIVANPPYPYVGSGAAAHR